MEVPDFPYNQFSYVVPFIKVFAARNGSYFEKANRSVLIASLDSDGDAESSIFRFAKLRCYRELVFGVRMFYMLVFLLSLCLLQKKEEGKLCQARLG